MEKNEEISNFITKQNREEGTDSLSATQIDTFSLSRLFFVWLKIGFTSFGGGAVTQYLIQENFIYKYKWISDEEYARFIGMGQIAPGINILAYTILIGKQLAGWKGIFVSLFGLILPSAALTVAISAVYTVFSSFPRVQSALRTVFAAILGISMATSWRNVKPIFVKNRKVGLIPFMIIILIMLVSAAIYVLLNPPVILLYICGGICGALTYWYYNRKNRESNKCIG